MSANFNISDFSTLAKQLLEKCENGEEFFLGHVHGQIRQAYEKFPEDAVIRSMAAVVERMAEKYAPSTIISQKQLSTIYNDLVRLAGDTKFRTVLGHLLLPMAETKKVATNLRDNRGPIEERDLIDPRVKDILSDTFDDDLAAKVLNTELASKGISHIKAELKSIGFGTCSVKVAGGDANRVFYNVSFDTVRGPVAVYVPASVKGGKFMMPNTFIDDSGEKELKASILEESLVRRSMKLEDVGGQVKRAECDLPALVLPETVMPTELSHLTHDFENVVLETTSTFGKEAVAMGKKVVATELRAAGFKNAQVKFGSDSGDAVVYLASINTPQGVSEIEVPVEMKATADDKFVPLMPACFAYNEQLYDFSAANLQKFATDAITSGGGANPLYSFMMLGELKEELVKCASVNNYEACEEILNHIGATFAEEDYRNAVADYQYVLGIKNAAANGQVRASEIAQQVGTMIPAGKGSLYARMANGKPIKDMVKDENGRYRSATEMAKEKLNKEEDGGACIQSHQILFS
jgi:hypothetical protein